MNNGENKELKMHKIECIRVAKDLCYPEWVLDEIRYAKSVAEVDRAMINGRRAM